ncbi:actin cortical patch SUR7/pH-response regulator pali [Suillus subaureus]|uniref:Actin cortical patch SUR7/pH-response regulator pali n=1 Tax=Suillus subaureus TaxID=48587 RepID=A0A9P7JJD0_9AGAM|nr:actin cortical patch SUR7/pH-response regulator pali [Suillus subaureus]KAG1826253.1 actin cortical patch SUR7/pH-response regulator pali [Suillus subaureus]
MRGEYCVGGASFLSFVALLLLIFVHVGQINTSLVPHGIAMAKVNTSGFGQALNESIFNPIGGLYTTNYTSPLGEHNGLRQFYDFGLYSYCAYVNSSAGTCTNHTIANNFEPYTAMKSDMLANYSQYSDSMFVNTTFVNSAYLAYNSRVAYYFILIGTIFATIALFTGVAKRALLFFVSTASSIMAALFILIGAAIWTSIVKKCEDINTLEISHLNGGVVSGIIVSYGNGIYLAWAAFACLAAATVPYMVSCCTFRG